MSPKMQFPNIQYYLFIQPHRFTKSQQSVNNICNYLAVPSSDVISQPHHKLLISLLLLAHEHLQFKFIQVCYKSCQYTHNPVKLCYILNIICIYKRAFNSRTPKNLPPHEQYLLDPVPPLGDMIKCCLSHGFILTKSIQRKIQPKNTHILRHKNEIRSRYTCT